MKRKILTVKNQAVLYKKLKTYLEEVLEEEEYFNSFDDLYQEAYRVKCCGIRFHNNHISFILVNVYARFSQ